MKRWLRALACGIRYTLTGTHNHDCPLDIDWQARVDQHEATLRKLGG